MRTSTQTTNTTPKDLRIFGLIFAVMLSTLFGLFLPYSWGFSLPVWPWIVSGIFLVLAVALPISLKPIYIVWMKLGAVLGWVNTRIILTFIFYFLITPIALLLRALRIDLLKQLDKKVGSYRDPCTPQNKEHMEKPY